MTIIPSFIPVDFDPFGDIREIEKIIPTNEPQREIWLSCMIGGEEASLSYNESVSLKIKGTLNIPAFKKAVDDLVRRHEALRATISPNGETLIVYRNFPIILEQWDISEQNDEDQEKTLASFVREVMDSPLDLYEGPLFKVSLHKIKETEFFFTIVKHHIIGDGWSTGIMLEDLSKMYNAYQQGDKIFLGKPAQMSDYANAQNRFKNTQAYQQTEDFWINVFKGEVPVLDLPTDFPRQAPRTYRGQRIDCTLSKAFVSQIKAVGAKAGCSLVTTLLAAFEVFLYKTTNQKEIVVGLPASGQAASGLYDLVGHCVNLLPLKTTVNANKSFADYLKKRKGEVLDAYDHQRITFGELIKKLHIRRDPSRIPLVPVIFNIDMGMDNAVAFDDLDYELISNPRAYEHFEIFLNATGSKDGLTLEWSYNTGLFSAKTINRFNAEFKTILEKIVLDPALSISELTGIENKAVPGLEEVYFPANETINSLIAESVAKYPNQTALKFNQQTLTYKQLDDRVNQLASFIVSKEIKAGEIVAISLERSTEMLISLLAILKTGAVYLPLDPEYPVDRIEFMLEDSAAKMLLVSEQYQHKFQSNAEKVFVDDIWPELHAYSDKFAPATINGSDLAYILYTSGSTGKPKGVKITHRNLANFLISMRTSPGIKDTDKLLAITTISFDIAGLELYLPLIAGAEIVLASSEAIKDGRILLSLLEEKEVTVMQATPSTWQMILDSGWQKKMNVKVLSGGEPLPFDLATKLLGLSDELWNMYGPTETTIWSTIKQIKPNDTTLTIGCPINNTQIYIVDEHGNVLPDNEVGEIYIGGEGVAEGYLNRPELTDEKFVNDWISQKPKAKLYRTGDLGKILSTGEIQCLGRTDHQVKIRGHRIELGEIEAIISKQDGIKHAVVMAREDALNDKRLIAYVTLESEEDANKDTVTWKEHWDTIYEIGAKDQEQLSAENQNIDGILLEHLANSEDLKKQAAEWLSTSVERIKEIKASRIYEIGSGAGQILYEVAPTAEHYIATDYAEVAINNINLHIAAEPGKWDNVEAFVAPADDFSVVENVAVDMVLINSVAQYFRDADYLLGVIASSIKSLANGGCIFIGDMQGKNSLTMFRAMEHLPRDPDSNTLEKFKAIVENQVRIEGEFVADPAFFYVLPKMFSEITGVDVQLRKGKSLNETTKYHYDVWIFVNKPVRNVKSQVVKNWNELNEASLLYNLMEKNASSVVEITNILNSRTAKDFRLFKLLNTASSTMPVSEIKSVINGVNEGLHPDFFWETGEKFGMTTHVRWTTDGTDGTFDVVFIPKSGELVLPEFGKPELLSRSIYEFARTPASRNIVHLSKELVQKWKDNLIAELPSYMVPDDFFALKSFPLTPNAKIDRKALPKPDYRETKTNPAESRILTKNEELVNEIWTEVLGLDELNIDDDFFELGGHSLLAVKVMVAIEKKTGKRLPLATLFNNSTIAKLARQIADNRPCERWESLVPIQTGGSKTPIFLIHGGGLNILLFRTISAYFDKDQPVYGLQALGLNHETDVPWSIEEIAERYAAEILEVCPNGPYVIAGYSLGGFIAFEVAKQLKAMGKEIKLLGVMDTYAGNNGNVETRMEHTLHKIQRQFNKLPFFAKSFVKYPKESLEYQLIISKKRLDKLISPGLVDTKDMLNEYELEIYKHYDHAHRNYKLKPADLKVTLFRVAKRLYFIDDFIYLGWNKFARQGVDIKEIPGDHKTFLYPPNDKQFAEILQESLNNL